MSNPHIGLIEDIRALPPFQCSGFADNATITFSIAVHREAVIELIRKYSPSVGSWVRSDDVDRLVRELDEAWNGKEGMAQQASLCDIVGQIINEIEKQPISLPEGIWRCAKRALDQDAQLHHRRADAMDVCRMLLRANPNK